MSNHLKWTLGALLLSLGGLTGCGEREPDATPGATWAAAFTVSPTAQVTVAGVEYASSAQLAASWTAPAQAVDHYLLAVRNTITDGTSSVMEAGASTSKTLTELQSATSYAVTLTACLNSACDELLMADANATGATAEEHWQIRGEGTESTFGEVPPIVPSGLTLAYAIRYGASAEATLEGFSQLYYNSGGLTPGEWPGMRIARTDAATTATDNLASYTRFDTGLKAVCAGEASATTCPAGELNVLAWQIIPLTEAPFLRFYAEASDANVSGSATRIYSLDAQDGMDGQDFNPDSTRSSCGDVDGMTYGTAGECELNIELGVESDTAKGGTGLNHARQFKIGYPKRTDWRWDQSVGTFMVITGQDACGETADGLFYAKWDGAKWDVDQDGNCAVPLVKDAHGPVIVHLGGGRYKLYYEAIDEGGQIQSDKNTRVLYADAARTGDTQVVDRTDWDAESDARDVSFLWPDGTLLTLPEESGLGDHMILIGDPTPGSEIMYMNLGGPDSSISDTWGNRSNGLGIATLINP